MKFYRIAAAFLISFLFTNCRSVTTGQESIKPKIFVYHVLGTGQGSTLIGHSDPNVEISSRGCPSGSFNELPNSYITNMSNTLNFNVTSTDAGGVRKLVLELTPCQVSEVSNVNFANSPGTQAQITQATSNTVTIEADFTNLLTGQVVTFSVDTDSEALTITGQCFDFNNNMGEIKQSDGTNLPALVVDQVICDRDLLEQ